MTFSASVYYHDVLSLQRTEQLLTEDQSYLCRRSPLNPDKFILSYFVKNEIKHEIVESPKSTRKNISFQDVVTVVQDMVSSNKNCLHAVFSPPRDAGRSEEVDVEDQEKRKSKKKEKSSKKVASTEDDEAESSENEPPTAAEKSGVNDEGSSSIRKSKRKGSKSVKLKKKKTAASPSDKEANDAARTAKESAKKTAKMAIKKAKLAAVSDVQKVETEMNRGRKTDRQPQCYVCHQSFENTKKLKDHLNRHRVRKCQHCDVFVSSKNFSSHSKVCSESPKLKCDHCDFKTHYKSSLLEHAKCHSREKFPCSTCGKQFATKERLAAHEDCHERGLKCNQCPEVFRTVSAKYWHVRKKHMNKTITTSAGFFSIDSSFLQQTEGVKKSKPVHRCDKCDYKTFKASHFSRHKLTHNKPKKEKKIGVYRCVKGCHYYTKNTYNFNRHIENCRRFKATRPKTRPLITKSHVCKIANTVVISNKKMKTILHALRDVIGEDMFEKGIDKALSENLNRLGDDYETTQLEYKDSEGNIQHTAFVCVKDINDIIAKVIKKRKIKKPLVVVGSDGGQGKVICSLQIHDLSKKGKDSDGLEPGGRRRVILLAAADGAKESRELTDHFCESLKLWTVAQEMIVIGDAKMTNCCLGE